MHERNHVLREAGQLREEQTPAALATLVDIEGSSYRLEGAHMLIR